MEGSVTTFCTLAWRMLANHLGGRHSEFGLNPVQCGRFFDEGKLAEQRADFLLRPKSLLGHVFVGSPVNFLVV